jgi:hypothetical protein
MVRFDAAQDIGAVFSQELIVDSGCADGLVLDVRRNKRSLLERGSGKDVCGSPPQTALRTQGRGVGKPV